MSILIIIDFSPSFFNCISLSSFVPSTVAILSSGKSTIISVCLTVVVITVPPPPPVVVVVVVVVITYVRRSYPRFTKDL